jgi:hypothetical protein
VAGLTGAAAPQACMAPACMHASQRVAPSTWLPGYLYLRTYLRLWPGRAAQVIEGGQVGGDREEGRQVGRHKRCPMGWVEVLPGSTAFRSDCAFPPLCVVSSLCSAVLRERCRVHLPTLPYPTQPKPTIRTASNVASTGRLFLGPSTYHVLTPPASFPTRGPLARCRQRRRVVAFRPFAAATRSIV